LPFLDREDIQPDSFTDLDRDALRRHRVARDGDVHDSWRIENFGDDGHYEGEHQKQRRTEAFRFHDATV
jgi:hypothetical protein